MDHDSADIFWSENENSRPQAATAPADEMQPSCTKEQAVASEQLAILPDSPAFKEMLAHGDHVSALTQMLFESLKSRHKLHPVWLRRLQSAARYHDIGVHKKRKAHHKTSMRLIEVNLALNILDDDRPWVALLARYHRKKDPSQKHRRFAALSKKERKELCKAIALLRIADALDYTHKRLVQRIETTEQKKDITLICLSNATCKKEVSRLKQKGKLFKRIFKRGLKCRIQAQ